MARTPVRRDATSTPSITSVGRSHQQDINSRMARYALAMGIRTTCFVLIFVLHGPWMWVAAGGAVLLPYVAVLIANAGRERLPVTWGSGRSPRPVASPHDGADAEPVAPQAVMPVQVVRGETVEPDQHDGRLDPRRPVSGDAPPERDHAA